jgi:ribose-phosphate pyrophosphokinase
VDFERDEEDYRKFDGQAFSSSLYAQMLRAAGVDAVITVHNHSTSVQRLFTRTFGGRFLNLNPAALFSHYLTNSNVVREWLGTDRLAGRGAHLPLEGAAGRA